MLKPSLKRMLSLVALACLLFWPACSTTNKNLMKQVIVESRKSLADGDFEKALSGFREATKKNPNSLELEVNYVQTVEEIKQAADHALSQRDYTRSGGLYLLLLNNFADFGAFATKLTFKKSSLETALKEGRMAIVDNLVSQAVKTGNFAKALDLYHSALKENPGDVGLMAKYRGTVNEIKAYGDKAFGVKDFARSGKMNVLLLKNFTSIEGLKPPVAFTREVLNDAIAACRESLTKTGLTEYRKGNLAKAIALWEGLLSFDSDNAEIKKAVHTAKTQLEGIKKI